jgi:hypothetical protein
MKVKRVALMLSIVVCAAGVVSAQTIWKDYPGNPVIEPGGPGEWDCGGRLVGAVVLMGDTYHMWFWGVACENPDVNHGIGHATSDDGITWAMDLFNPVLDHGQPGEWDERFGFPSMAVIHDGTQYVMWYLGSSFVGSAGSVGRATSPDGTAWTKDVANNPVLVVGPPGAWDDYWVGPGAVVLEGDVYKMWFNGANGSFGQIGYAESPDGITWTKYASNPVLRTGPPGPWDAWVFNPSVVLEGSTYHMWYSGNNRSGGDWMLGYAFSGDGIHWWRYQDNPVIHMPGQDNLGLPVIFDGSTWHGWFGDTWHAQRIFYVTSTCCAGVFGDGFETGDTSAWSGTVP